MVSPLLRGVDCREATLAHERKDYLLTVPIDGSAGYREEGMSESREYAVKEMLYRGTVWTLPGF